MRPVFICVLLCTKVSTLLHKRHDFRKKVIQQLFLLLHYSDYSVPFPHSFLKSFQRSKCILSLDADRPISAPQIKIRLPPLQKKKEKPAPGHKGVFYLGRHQELKDFFSQEDAVVFAMMFLPLLNFLATNITQICGAPSLICQK